MIKSNLKEKNEEGITLIALVITIVVLLILAGISIQMLTGDNGILTRAGEAKQATEKASAKEQVQLEVVGSFDAKTKPNLNVLKDRLSKIGAEVKNSDFPLYVIYKGNEFIISENGEMTDLGNGGVTLLAKINAQVSEMNESEKLEFYQGFYGKTVKYEPKETIETSTSTANTPKKAQWKIFYADEEHIYLIADSYVTYDSLPKALNVDESIKYSFSQSYSDSENTNYNIYKAHFRNSGLLTEYAGGTAKINTYAKANTVKALNKDFFYWKNPSTNVEEGLTGTGYDCMKAVGSMLDTEFWDNKYKDNTGYAYYTIGGPTIEILFASYNQTHGTNYGAKAYMANEMDGDTKIAKYDGYKISLDAEAERTSNDWGYSKSMLSNDLTKSINGLYISENNGKNADAYWLASPSVYYSDLFTGVMYVKYDGRVSSGFVLDDAYKIGFRPIICLKPNVLLKELPEGSDYNFELSF